MSDEFLTQEGLVKIKQDLVDLKEKRKDITSRIQSAKELGDLSENAEYSEAKDAQGLNESEIARLNDVIKHAKVIKKSKSKTQISLGSTAHVKIGKKEMTLSIVGSNEVSPKEGKISNESPIGKILLGKAKGDKLEMQAPKGKQDVTVLEII